MFRHLLWGLNRGSRFGRFKRSRFSRNTQYQKYNLSSIYVSKCPQAKLPRKTSRQKVCFFSIFNKTGSKQARFRGFHKGLFLKNVHVLYLYTISFRTNLPSEASEVFILTSVQHFVCPRMRPHAFPDFHEIWEQRTKVERCIYVLYKDFIFPPVSNVLRVFFAVTVKRLD